jgi:hypothetical protein
MLASGGFANIAETLIGAFAATSARSAHQYG